MTLDPESLLPVAMRAAEIANDMMQTRRPVSVTEKHDRDLVSDVDVAIERAVRGFLQEETPEIGFLGEEEGGSASPATGWLWTLDPIDGTSNFAHGVPLCASTLALLRDGSPVLGVIDAPFLGQRYHAVKGQGAHVGQTRLAVSSTARLRDAVVSLGDYATGPGADRDNEKHLAVTVQLAPRVNRIRMLGTAALDLAWVAEGRLDASVILGNKPWDTAAGVLIAREAGATVVDADGSPHGYESAATITASPALIDQLLALIQAAGAGTPGSQDRPQERSSPYAALDAILGHARYLIFDFDGPICDLSAAMPADTASRLGAIILARHADHSVRHTATRDDDPLDVLTRAAAISPAIGGRVDAELTSIELAASASAAPAAYIHEAIAACRDSGRAAVVISRHAANVVSTYLAEHSLADQFAHVITSSSYPPGHLQPFSNLLQDAFRALGTRPASCALITASATGVLAALNAGVSSIGYAITTDANELVTAAGAECVLPSLADLTLRLRARPIRS